MTRSRFPPLARLPRWLARLLLPYLATAALLGLTLVMAFATMGKGRSAPEEIPTHLPELIRMSYATPGEVDAELLFETRFTPDQLPAGDVQAIFYRLTLPPETHLSALVGPVCLCRTDFVAAGIGFEVVQSGTYSLQLDTPFRVQSKDASKSPEAIAARREVVLRSGDAAVYPDYAGSGTIQNTGDTPAVIIGMAVVTMAGTGIPLPPLPKGVRVELLASSQPADLKNLPPGAVAVSLWRLRLPAGTTVGPYAGSRLEALSTESGLISRRYLRVAAQNPNLKQLTQYVGVESIFLAPAPGIRRSITSEAGEPAEVLALAIEPEAIWSATLAP